VTAVSYSLEFRGYATPLDPGVLLGRGSAPSDDGCEALLETRVTLVGEDGFEQLGTISFGNGDAVRFRSRGLGVLSNGDDVRHGTAICDVESGCGRFAGAGGRITTSFLVSATGELTEDQLARIVLPEAEP
jgi:hypothetical protein